MESIYCSVLSSSYGHSTSSIASWSFSATASFLRPIMEAWRERKCQICSNGQTCVFAQYILTDIWGVQIFLYLQAVVPCVKRNSGRGTNLLSEDWKLVINWVILHHSFFNQRVDLCRELLNLKTHEMLLGHVLSSPEQLIIHKGRIWYWVYTVIAVTHKYLFINLPPRTVLLKENLVASYSFVELINIILSHGWLIGYLLQIMCILLFCF